MFQWKQPVRELGSWLQYVLTVLKSATAEGPKGAVHTETKAIIYFTNTKQVCITADGSERKEGEKFD